MQNKPSECENTKFGEAFLQEIVDWIAEHFTPDDVFLREEIVQDVRDGCYSYSPEDLFEYDALCLWAEQNGFYHPE